ncbi:MAG: peptidoglycan-associated lipoprotein [Campylobacterota bacterium]|nr:peptidoglycan-associated lipoprotein [Campylobacterota bacterium]
MKNIVMSSVVAAVLLFSGCSDKDPKVEDNSGAAQAVAAAPVATSVPSSRSESVSSAAVESESEMIARLQKELATINFDFDKFNINAANQPKVPANAEVLKTKASKFSTKLEGNCDEWGSDEYNIALGLKRANEVKKALSAEGVNADKITMVSYGESNPVCTEKTKECWAQNRRVDFKLLP